LGSDAGIVDFISTTEFIKNTETLPLGD
jgi:hypothetical protein